MNRLTSRTRLGFVASVLVLVLFGTGCAALAQHETRFDRPGLDAMLAPIALYPDPLLSQVLMAAAYPEEIREAARWLRERPGLSGDAAVRSSQGWDWDPSVRSLLAFPQVLQTLADYPRWTRDLGDAFLGQREEVMETIQHLRRRAIAEGTLRSNEWTRVVDAGYAIIIEQTSPQTVHVPYYDPRIAYGPWWWPSRPPMHWSPWPGYHPAPGRDPYVYWGPGVFLGSGFFFGNFVWQHREVRVVNVRPHYYPQTIVIERQIVPGHTVIERRAPAPDTWRPDPRRRWSEDRRRDDRRDDDQRRDARPADIQRQAGPRPPEELRAPPARIDMRDDRRGPDRRDEGGPPPVRVAPAQRAPEPAPIVTSPPRPDTREPRGDRPHRDEPRGGPPPDTRTGDRRTPPPPMAERPAPPPPQRSATQATPAPRDSGEEARPVRRSKETRD